MIIREGNPRGVDETLLLDEYFAFRAAAFPAGQHYTATHPDPADYEGARGVFLVIDDENGPIGCAGLRRIDDSPEGLASAEIKHVWLRPESRGRGAADEIMAEMEARARAWGVDQLVLDTHHTLDAAARLYARHEFVPIEPYNTNPNATRWYGKRLTRRT